MSSTSKRNQAIDILRIPASIFVVLCHIAFPGRAGVYSSALARWAVPFFMIITGWYIWHGDNEDTFKAAKRMFFSMLVFTVKSVLFISCVNSVVGLIKHEKPYEWLVGYFSTVKVAVRYFLLFNRAHFLSSIVWYLFAMIYVLAIYTILAKFKKVRWGFWLIVPLIITHLIIVEGLKMKWFYGLNWMLTGIPFVFLGSYLRSSNRWRRIPKKICWLMIPGGSILTLIEAHRYRECGLFIGTIPLILGIVFLSFVSERRFPDKLALFGKACTPYIFVLHCSLRDLVYAIWGKPESTVFPWIAPFLFFALTAVVSASAVLIRNRLKERERPGLLKIR